MLMVHPPPRHQRQPRHPPIVDRGRSRDISPVALARRASEERRIAQRRALVHAIRVQDPPLLSTSSSETTPSDTEEEPPSSNSEPRSTVPSCSNTADPDARPLSCLSSTSLASSEPLSPAGDSLPCCFAASTLTTEFSSARPRGSVADLCSESQDVSDDGVIPPRSLQEQMQEAYAAENMHLARILFLKIQGIEVKSDDDPRIAQVRDEDFVFVPGGRLELDDESLAVWREAQRRQEAKADGCKRQVMQGKLHQGKDSHNETEVHHAKLSKQPARGNAFNLKWHRLEINHKSRLHPISSRRANTSARPCSLIDSYPSPSTSPSSSSVRQRMSGLSSSLPSARPKLTRTTAATVSFKEVMYRMQGALFPEDESESCCIAQKLSTQDRLLSTLLEDVNLEGRRRRITVDKRKLPDSARSWVADRLVRTSTISTTNCLACSADTSSSISRTNSWASYTSSGSVSTFVTSPPNSPSFEKLPLPPLIDDKNFRQRVIHSCRRYRKSRLTPVPLSESPLLLNDSTDLQHCTPSKHISSPDRHRAQGKNVVIARVKQSFSSLLDFANRVQLSYIRTIQFSVPLPMEPNLLFSSESLADSRRQSVVLTCKPFGYRVCTSDVQKFVPNSNRGPIRELNFASETNIPLLDMGPEYPVSRVFSPLAFVPPSPSRPRKLLCSPEWRLRPVANPVTLRLKALSNRLYERGIPWEGRAPAGSLGCGRERLTGVAFEGLGGSRLAFEAK